MSIASFVGYGCEDGDDINRAIYGSYDEDSRLSTNSRDSRGDPRLVPRRSRSRSRGRRSRSRSRSRAASVSNQGRGRFRYYAVSVGRFPGVYSSHAEAHEQVIGVSGGRTKGFNSHEEARAFAAQGVAVTGTGGYGEPPRARRRKRRMTATDWQRFRAEGLSFPGNGARATHHGGGGGGGGR